jgi:hypothetical protein
MRPDAQHTAPRPAAARHSGIAQQPHAQPEHVQRALAALLAAALTALSAAGPVLAEAPPLVSSGVHAHRRGGAVHKWHARTPPPACDPRPQPSPAPQEPQAASCSPLQQQQRQQQRGGSSSTTTTSSGGGALAASSLADVAALFGGDPVPERDPVEPFTLYGTSSKKYVIEQLDGSKVVARKRGFTVSACISAIPQSQETPEFQGLPTGEKVGCCWW